jgi:hypothetical protein
MSKTRPTGEQLRFRSARTGDHILDDYLEAVELGNRTLADILADTHATDTGLFRADIFEFRFHPSTGALEFRVGDFPDAATGWRALPNSVNTQALAAAAEAARDAALASANNAATSATASAASASSSSGSAAAASSSATASATSATNSATSATNSANSAAASQTSRLASEAARDLSQDYRDAALAAQIAVEAIYGPSGSGAIVQLGRRALPDDGMSMVLGRRF